MAVSTISQAGLDAPITLTSPTLTSPSISGTPVMGASVITSGTSQASTSGTSIDFTSIPSWVKRITVMFNGVSTNGTSYKLIQIGSGSVTTTGYVGAGAYAISSGATGVSFTAGAGIITAAAAEAFSGVCTITLQNSSTNSWVFSGTYAWTAGTPAGCLMTASSIALGGTLDRVRITTVAGTDAFDAGSINILYE
jgi:hypothetical protein